MVWPTATIFPGAHSRGSPEGRVYSSARGFCNLLQFLQAQFPTTCLPGITMPHTKSSLGLSGGHPTPACLRVERLQFPQAPYHLSLRWRSMSGVTFLPSPLPLPLPPLPPPAASPPLFPVLRMEPRASALLGTLPLRLYSVLLSCVPLCKSLSTGDSKRLWTSTSCGCTCRFFFRMIVVTWENGVFGIRKQ